MIILVDLDDVLADFDGGFYKEWKRRHPDKFIVPPDKRTKFYLREEMPDEYKDLITEIIITEGFIESLPEIEGGKQAIYQMEEMGYNVFICTSPFRNYKYCVTEKYKWVEIHLGKDWVNKLILTNDKTLVNGNYLIDDKPEITGCVIPRWEHILYDRSYNRHIKEKRRLNWNNWKEIISPNNK
ncbi:MAG: 5'-3'-deoxyribonucleotidase [Ignavibacteria bacterium]|nr:5'-3'-deoxyribonucleotidase [Ignavibacteria bacterium]